MPQHIYLERHGTHSELVIALHGFAAAGDRLSAVRETITEALPNADIFAPALPFLKGRLCQQKAECIVRDLMSEIDDIVAERGQGGGRYEEIIFVGHSFGAVLARRLAILAFGEQHNIKTGRRFAPFETELEEFRDARSWARSIRRIVLLAGMNRGWSTSSPLDWITSIFWSVGQFAAETIFRGRPTILAIRRGAPFLVQTRLQWLALMSPRYGPRNGQSLRPDIITVQLLGTEDDRVAPDDNVDYAVDLFGTEAPDELAKDGDHPQLKRPHESSYFYIEVPYSNHPNVVLMGRNGPATEPADRRAGRRDVLMAALTKDRPELAALSIPRERMEDNQSPRADWSVTDVVFVIHGIRDKGYWTQKIARTVKRHTEPGRKFASLTSSYGYFAMLPFIFRSVRQRKVEWLMDCYTEMRARYPKADFHYFGHSNGTYLAAQALLDYPACHFKHIVFAGSVVRCDYPWSRLISPDAQSGHDQKVVKVLNYVATRDWVVALFPKALQPWRRANLGAAGHDGFDEASPDGPVYQIKYIVGSHGAGHEEPYWDESALFINSGEKPPRCKPPIPVASRQNRLWRAAGAISFILFPIAAAIVVGIGLFILWSIVRSSNIYEAVGLTAAFFLYLFAVYLTVTRV
jgi:pimeloyl-ACP methyl ester carboxylesterase